MVANFLKIRESVLIIIQIWRRTSKISLTVRPSGEQKIIPAQISPQMNLKYFIFVVMQYMSQFPNYQLSVIATVYVLKLCHCYISKSSYLFYVKWYVKSILYKLKKYRKEPFLIYIIHCFLLSKKILKDKMSG